ncbi:hypothetical protein E9549_08620 [Blastococcus sp. MG754426]|uniref:hypothetical protein n=1 Tax=unclassified Blastococcus TaxID=2619396 RepID=UPI001EF02517|nr:MULTISPECIES: hypothetical protein [unclassified Blastococcus]MCF6507471.1 hypothetical protein [Blastococcus sp. MG754426]MCF6512588.1 hypothetical protein [Blastococcus sp. MG754427]
MRITHTHNPVEMPTSQLLDLNAPDAGTLAISMRPGSKYGNWVYRDLLAAMGKDRDYAAARTQSVADDRAVTQAYLRAHTIQRIVVVHCEWARARTRDEGLGYLLELADDLDLDLDLVSELDRNSTARNWVAATGGDLLDWDPQRFQAPAEIIERRGTSAFPPEVPYVDFPLFRATCRRLLSPEEFRQVDNAYVFAFRSARAILTGDLTEAETINFLRVQLASVVNPAHAATILRACQAAAFVNGILLKIDLSSLGYFIADATHRRLTGDELRLVRRLYAPWKAAAVVLTDAQLSIEQLLTLQVSDVTDTGAVTAAGTPVPLCDEGRLHLRALRFQRCAEEAKRRTAATTRLFTSEAPAIRTALHAARRDLGLPLTIPRWRDATGKHPFVTDLDLSVHRLRDGAAA